MGVEQGWRGRPSHSVGGVCQSARLRRGHWSRKPVTWPLKWCLSVDQPHLHILHLVSISGMSSQGQTLSGAFSALASPHSPSDPFVSLSLTHSTSPLLCCVCLFIFYFLSFPLSFSAPSSGLFPFSLLSLWFPTLPFLTLYHSLSVSIFPSLHPPPHHTSPNRRPLCPEALRVAAGIYSSPTPNTHPAWQV